MPKHSATSAAPVDCPTRRDVATMPLAPPLRSRGAADMIARRFGDWKKPNPAPQIIIRHTMSPVPGCAASVAISVSPTQSAIMPIPPRMAGG